MVKNDINYGQVGCLLIVFFFFHPSESSSQPMSNTQGAHMQKSTYEQHKYKYDDTGSGIRGPPPAEAVPVDPEPDSEPSSAAKRNVEYSVPRTAF